VSSFAQVGNRRGGGHLLEASDHLLRLGVYMLFRFFFSVFKINGENFLSCWVTVGFFKIVYNLIFSALLGQNYYTGCSTHKVLDSLPSGVIPRWGVLGGLFCARARERALFRMFARAPCSLACVCIFRRWHAIHRPLSYTIESDLRPDFIS